MADNLIGLIPWPSSTNILSYALSNGFVGTTTPRSKDSCNTLSGRLGGTSCDWNGSLGTSGQDRPEELWEQHARSHRSSAVEAGANYHPLDEQDMHFLGVGKNIWLDKLQILWPT